MVKKEKNTKQEYKQIDTFHFGIDKKGLQIKILQPRGCVDKINFGDIIDALQKVLNYYNRTRDEISLDICIPEGSPGVKT